MNTPKSSQQPIYTNCGEPLTPQEVSEGVCWTCLEDPFTEKDTTATAQEWPDFHGDHSC